MLGGGTGKLAVVGMGMHVGVGPWGGGCGRGLMLNGPEHVLPIPTGAEMDGWSERRGDRCTGHVVVTYTDRVSDMEHMMTTPS